MRPTTTEPEAGAAPDAAPAPADTPRAAALAGGAAASPPVSRLADGVELLGRFEDSGFVDPPYLARRGDGQVLQLTPLLHHVAEAADGRRTTAEVAERVGAAVGKNVTADNVEFLVAEKLRPLGVMAAADGSSPPMSKPDPLLALRHRRRLVSEGAVWRIAGVFAPLFAAPVVALVLLALLAFDVYVLLEVGVGGGLRQALYEPALLLGLFAATIVATAFHEVGHASACRYGGARPGGMGAAIYLVWPAFFCDVTDAYRLDRRGRLRVDFGGVYFNAVFCVVAAGLYLATRFEPLILLLVTQHLLVLQQLLPLLRFDGYYVLSDLAGVPDVLGRVKPVLRSLLPGRGDEPRVTELKPRRAARFASTSWRSCRCSPGCSPCSCSWRRAWSRRRGTRWACRPIGWARGRRRPDRRGRAGRRAVDLARPAAARPRAHDRAPRPSQRRRVGALGARQRMARWRRARGDARPRGRHRGAVVAQRRVRAAASRGEGHAARSRPRGERDPERAAVVHAAARRRVPRRADGAPGRGTGARAAERRRGAARRGRHDAGGGRRRDRHDAGGGGRGDPTTPTDATAGDPEALTEAPAPEPNVEGEPVEPPEATPPPADPTTTVPPATTVPPEPVP